jgi:16S rRNA (guanine527-N7)-methyltransferase
VRVLRIELAAEARVAIDGHVRLLLAWNAAINLTAITDPADVARRHVADSLTAFDLIGGGPHASLLDLGSGGGFPGLPLAATLPATRVLLVDSTAKKAAFLEAVRQAVGLADRVAVAAGRAEALAPGAAATKPGAGPATGHDVVTARAVGPLDDLIELSLPLLAMGGRLVAWKRGDLAAELTAAGRAGAALGGGKPVVHAVPEALGLAGHALVVVRKEGPTPAGFPRDPAARKRRPW